MGAVCACAQLEKAGPSSPSGPRDEHQDEELSDEGSDVQASSDDDVDHEGVKQGVSDILAQTGKNLKRGKTMAMKEAIATAKKTGVDVGKISEAEKRLDEHKKQQRREEVEKEVQQFKELPAYKDMQAVDKMIKKAIDADVNATVVDALKEHLQELIMTRKLEDEESSMAREYLKRSCRELVLASTKRKGRNVTLLRLSDGAKIPGSVTLDPTLRHMCVAEEAGPSAQALVTSLKVLKGKDDKKVSKSSAFTDLDANNQDCILSISYEANGQPGSWCLIEPTSLLRDRLREAVTVLIMISKG